MKNMFIAFLLGVILGAAGYWFVLQLPVQQAGQQAQQKATEAAQGGVRRRRAGQAGRGREARGAAAAGQGHPRRARAEGRGRAAQGARGRRSGGRRGRGYAHHDRGQAQAGRRPRAVVAEHLGQHHQRTGDAFGHGRFGRTWSARRCCWRWRPTACAKWCRPFRSRACRRRRRAAEARPRPQRAARLTRQTTLPTSSATSSAPSRSKATPTGRP